MLTALRAGNAAVRLADGALRGDDLAGAIGAVAAQVAGARRVAVVATPSLATVVAIAGALEAGVTVVTINPKAGTVEREFVLTDSAPDLLLENIDLSARASLPAERAADESPALIIYTSSSDGTSQGCRDPAPRDCRQSGRARGCLVVDRAGSAGARAATFSRTRAGARCPRAVASWFRAAACAVADGRTGRDTVFRRSHDVVPGSPSRPRFAARGCWFPDPRRCQFPFSSGSLRAPVIASPSGTVSPRR